MIPAHAQAPVTAKRTRKKTITILALAVSACFLLAGGSLAAQKKPKPKKEETTQTLQLPRELPGAVIGETRRLTFHVTPLSARGLLSAQVRDALKALIHETGSDAVLHIRAFAAGSGDLRRIRDLVSEIFSVRQLPLPALSLIQAGGLPLEGAQVVLEAVAAGKKDVNPHGLAFFSAPIATSDDPLGAVEPLAAQSLDRLKGALEAAGSEPSDVVRVTCFLSSLENLAATRKLVETDYPRAALNYVQAQRSPLRALAACEAVARLRRDTGRRVEFQPEGGEPQAALVAAQHVVLTGTQVSYGYAEDNARPPFERLQKVLEAAGVSSRDVAFAHYYPLADRLAAQMRKARTEFSGKSPGSVILMEGLPGMDAGFAVDVIAVKD